MLLYHELWSWNKSVSILLTYKNQLIGSQSHEVQNSDENIQEEQTSFQEGSQSAG
jgi:hypothetical protein